MTGFREAVEKVRDHAAYKFKAGMDLVGKQKFGECVRGFQCWIYLSVVLEIYAQDGFQSIYREAQYCHIVSTYYFYAESNALCSFG